MSRFTDENGEQIYPTYVVVDHMTPKEQLNQQIENPATDEELKQAGWVKATPQEALTNETK